VWRVGTEEPSWRYDLEQSGTVGLRFDRGQLWVLGGDGSILAFPVAELARPGE